MVTLDNEWDGDFEYTYDINSDLVQERRVSNANIEQTAIDWRAMVS